MSAARAPARRWLAPEVVQTSSMDCGPAALKCLLEGHGIAASYGRLREACQTDVDGTSIDTLEEVARQLGLDAEQVLVPLDHVLGEAGMLPALVTVRLPDGAPHFVVVWRRSGPRLQVMDPATGRQWVAPARLAETLYRHEMEAGAAEWRAWAGTAAFMAPLARRMRDTGISERAATKLGDEALAQPGWFALAALDAAVRLTASLLRSGALARGVEAGQLLVSLYRRALADPGQAWDLIPRAWWSALPPDGSADAAASRITLVGAVLVKVAGRLAPGTADRPALSPELAAALSERAEHPLATVWRLLREDGLIAPLALVLAMLVSAGALLVEALLLRGMFDLAPMLAGSGQRLGGALALVAFSAVLLALRVPILAETLRHGRHLEVRLRMALATRLPRLPDRYFQSRPVSDMAERSHGLVAVRGLPALGLALVQTLIDLGFTLVGVTLLAPAAAWQAVAVVACAMLLPLMVQPLINERDLRVRNHAGALGRFTLDALLGLVPVRAHRAERNIRRQHEALLVEWTRAMRSWLRWAIASEGAQALVCTALAGWLIATHFGSSGGVTGSDLLLVFWVLKLPAIGSTLAGLAHQYPAQRNVLLRLMEPLAAPVDDAAATPAAATDAAPPAPAVAAACIELRGVDVLAAGHPVLSGIDCAIAPGEHVAVVGVSGAGKSSLLGLLLGWHRAAQGEMRVDGLPLDTARLETLRRTTAWVDPAIQVWNRSLLDNLGYASDDAGLARVGAVLEAGDLRPVVRKLPQGLQTVLGEGGARLSGGEGQRVRLGRALLMDSPRLVLLDEPFRGLDRERRRALLGEARTWWRASTLVAVTHDVEETLGFSRVLVVEDGRIVEDAAPADLMARASRYRGLVEAERALAAGLWRDAAWRRVAVRDGRAHETGSTP